MQKAIIKKSKKTSESRIISSYSIMPKDLNTKNTLYGARLLEFADNIAGSVAIRHSRGPVTTASVDSFDFIRPFRLGQFLFTEAFVSGVGNQSMEICIKFVGEDDFTGERFLGALAFLTFRAKGLEKDEILPKIQGETEEEIRIIEGYETRRAIVKEKIKRNEELKKTINLDF